MQEYDRKVEVSWGTIVDSLTKSEVLFLEENIIDITLAKPKKLIIYTKGSRKKKDKNAGVAQSGGARD